MNNEIVFVSVQGIKSKPGENPDYAVRYMFDEYGYKFHKIELPARQWWNVRYYAKKDGKALAEGIERFWNTHGPCKIVLIAHSFGTLVSCHALNFLYDKQVPVYAGWLFRGAMSWMWEFPGHPLNLTRITSIYSPNDRAIKAGRKMPFHAFGAAGNYGHFWADQVKISRFDGHSADFTPENWPYWADQLDEYIRQ